MKSKITIEVDFNNGNPYIRVINDKLSDDVRDKLISHFREKLGHISSWCKVSFEDSSESNSYFRIDPIAPSQLVEESGIMIAQAELLDKHPVQSQTIH